VNFCLLCNYWIGTSLFLIIKGYQNNPEETNISELKITNDLTDDEIKEIYDSLDKQIKDNPGIFA